jgi:hypothetical protein
VPARVPPNSGLQADAPEVARAWSRALGVVIAPHSPSTPVAASYGLLRTIASEIGMTISLEVLEAKALKLAR